MDNISRRNVLAASVAGGLIAAATAAEAQAPSQIPQPSRSPALAAPISVRAIFHVTVKTPTY
jgi:hypothetical protein